MSTVGSRFGSWRRLLLGLGPIGLASLFLVRATVPVVDALLLAIFAVLVAATVAAIGVLAVGDRADRTSPWRIGSLAGGGVALGFGLVAVFPVLAPQPAFGQGLDGEAIDELPVIEMLNYTYDPIVVEVGADVMYRARLVNPSDAPHTFTIESIDLEVYVPASRWAVLELSPDDLAGAPLTVICTIGDHLALGMAGVVEVE